MTLPTRRLVHLHAPRFSDEHIKEKIICIRPHRERIFRVQTETMGDKLICHNYGQGGAGWTFLFGCVEESIEHYEHALAINPHLRTQPIAIIGAGCYGLLTAIALTRKGYTVRIITRDAPGVLSCNAAGFFFPRPRKTSNEHERALFERLGIASYKQYLRIAHGTHELFSSGAKIVPAYYAPTIDPGFEQYIKQGLMPPPTLVDITFGNDKQYAVMEYTTIFIDVIPLLQELQRLVTTLSIPISYQDIASFDQLPESIIFNCAGLGAKKLANDARLIPVQGHLITLTHQAPMDMPYMLNVMITMPSIKGTPRDELLYYAPKQSGILGITFIRGQDSTTTNQHEFDRLLQRCHDFFGS